MFENLLSVGGLSLERLRNFCLVAERGGIARAAEGDPARQSLISRQIRELETFFGAELTRRKGKGIELTEAGRELARQARAQFQALGDFRASCAGLPVEFKIAAGNSILEWLVIPHLADAMTGVALSFLTMRTADIIRSLVDHTADFGIVRKSAVVAPLKFRPLCIIGYSLFVPSKLAKRFPKDPSSELPLAITVGGEFASRFEEAAARAGKAPRIAYRCASFTQVAHLVRSGACAAVLPEIAAPWLKGAASRLAVPWLRGYRREIGVAWHQRLLEIRPRAEAVLAMLLEATAHPPA